MVDQHFADESIDPLNQTLLALAAYNCGAGRLRELRAEASRRGLIPNVWFNNVERIASKWIGRGTVYYVSNIYNRRGHAAGFSNDASDLPHAVLWKGDAIIDLEAIAGAQSSALGINRRDQVVGFSTAITGGSIAFLWDHGRRFNLGTLTATAPNQVPFSIANSINQYGRIVGASSTASGNVHAVLWSEHRRIVDLGTAGGPNSSANSINDHGEIVGVSNTASGARHAVLWTR